MYLIGEYYSMIKVAKYSGFCFGVNRAIEIVESLLSQGKKVSTLGELIHNSQVIDNMKRKSVTVINTIDELEKGRTLVIRSHGVSRESVNYIKELKVDYVDATCPFVKKIHKIVFENSKNGKTILIAGDKMHPEVQGIVGHCLGKCFVFKNNRELMQIVKSDNLSSVSICVVSQTTFSIDEWNRCLNFLKKSCKKAAIFDTICRTTLMRQKEADWLSREVDLMVIIGDKKSSNTTKLYEICKKNCKAYHVESKDELPINQIKNFTKVGITAGASTPAYIIEEAAKVMNEVLKNVNQNEESVSFEQMLEESLSSMDNNNRVKGTVVSIAPNEVCVDVGRKQAGFIPANELSSDPNAKPEDIVKVGDEIEVLIMKTNDQDGTIMLSKKRVDSMKGWDKIVKAEEDGTILEGKVTEIVKGGVIVLSDETKVFIPASQVSDRKIKLLDDLKGENVRFKIIDINPRRRRAVGSVRAVLNEEKEKILKAFWENINVGDTYEGIVKSFTNYGAFVDLGGIDGMIHISELSWNRVKHPSEILKIGDKIKVIVKDLDRESQKISLTYKDTTENPWEKLKNDFPVGTITDVKIVGIAPFGAFANIIPGVDGLIHISQISNEHVNKVEDVLKVGDVVKVKIIDEDFDKMRVSLSMKFGEQESQ